MSQPLDQLINEISAITGLTQDDVVSQFTKEQLDYLLEVSSCDPSNQSAPFVTNIDDIPCRDNGAPIDSKDQSPPVYEDTTKKVKDSSKCVDSVDKVNEKVKINQRLYLDHTIILNKLYELKDNLSPLSFYYKERAKEMARIVGEFGPILQELKILKDQIYDIENISIPEQQEIIDYQYSLDYPDYVAIDNADTEKTDLLSQVSELETLVEDQNLLISGLEEKYPVMQNGTITGYEDTDQGITSRTYLKNEIKNTISNSTINNIENGLRSFSEYISIDIKVEAGSYSEILKSPLVGFSLKFQDLSGMNIETEEFDKKTGESKNYKKFYKIKGNDLLKSQSFFSGVPGYSVSNIKSKEISSGALYSKYYNLLDDPINNFFSLSEKGLSSSISQLDPNLKGSDVITKKENGKEYFIQDMDKMQNFYKNFDKMFEAKKKKVRSDIISQNLSICKSELEQVARLDVQALLAIGKINIFDEDSSSTYTYTDLSGNNQSFSGGARSGSITALDSISNANEAFIDVIGKLDFEISRIEKFILEIKPTPDKIKEMLKKESSECFGNIPKSDSDSDDGCPDIKSLMGSDPFFKSIDGIDPTLPNLSQGCYWKEFGKLATIQGLFPIPNNPTTLRYWPVGIVIPTPATLVKIPLPIVWVHLITISTPLGVLVIYLTINGIFISPVVFFVSASGYKQHLITIRGSSKKFGYDRNNDTIKSTIKIPLSLQASIDMAKVGGSIDVDKKATDEEKQKIQTLEEKEQAAKSSGDSVKAHKAKKQKEKTKKQIKDKHTPDSKKLKDAADKKDEIKEAVQTFFKDTFKMMDNIGKPPTNRITKLQSKAAKRKEKLQKQKIKAMEEGDSKKVKKINDKLKEDGLNINDKINAFIDDTLDYFDSIPFSKQVFPKDKDKLNPKEDTTGETKDKIVEESSKLNSDYVSEQSTQLKTIIGKLIAKFKNDLEKEVKNKSLDIDKNTEEVKKSLGDMISSIGDKLKGKGVKPIDPSAESNSLVSSKKEVDSADSEDKKKKAKNKLREKQGDLNKKMDLARLKDNISINSSVISLMSGFRVSMDPFAKCCSSDTFSVGIPLPPLTEIAIDTAISSVKSTIQSMSSSDLKSMFGGKQKINARDIRLGLLTTVQSKLPSDIKIPKPDLNLKSATSMFSGILGGLSMPQSPFPAPLSLDLAPSKVTLDYSILKSPIRSALSDYLSNNLLNKNAQSLETDFEYSNSNDIKSFMKQFIESQEKIVTDKITPVLKVLNSAKNSNGLDLNVLEKTVFTVPPYGPAALALFTAKGKIKMNMSKSDSQFVINEEAVAMASQILKTALTPIVSNPTAYILVAGAGVANRLELIRKIHPILNADDIPPWERLTLKNVLLLVFLDEFISTAADQVGWFRSFL